MKKEELFRLIGEADEQKVAAAGRAIAGQKKHFASFAKWGVMAACLGLLAVGTVLLLNSALSKEPDHYSVSAKTIRFSSLEEMEEYADVIIKATRTGEEKSVVKYNQGAVYSGYTFSTVKIEAVYKDVAGSLETGQELRILENEFFDENENIIYHVAGYHMMEEGKEYLLFLNQHMYSGGKAYYVAAGINFGTVSIQNDNRTAIYTTREGQIENPFEEIKPIWEAALAKYIK